MAGKDLKNDGGPAFPQLDMVAGERDGHGDIIEAYLCAAGGMTLRDWFAGQAITACAVQTFRHDAPFDLNVRQAAAWAYGMADAMIAARGAQ